MCGIAGFLGSFPPALLDAMSDKIRYRGPDGDGTWFDTGHGIGLAHRRLAIIDLSPGGAQPMRSEELDVTLSYNGEIYNYRELRNELQALGHNFSSQSDTEVVLKSYLEWGSSSFTRLEGIFAIAIWDGRTRELFLARDHMGVKPLYLTQTKRGFIFASEIKALLCASDVDRSLDHDALAAHLTYLWAPGPSTILKAVRKLEPGSFVRITTDRAQSEQIFFQLPMDEGNLTESEAAEALDLALHQSIQRQLVADVPVGAFLSGGLDSSAIVALAQQSLAEPMQCFTIDYPEEEAKREGLTRDVVFARKVAASVGVRLNEIMVAPMQPDALIDMVYTLDEPQADTAPLYVGQISAAARDAGIRVLLSGAGGDDLLTGYRRHYALLMERYWDWLPATVRGPLSAMLSRIPAGTPVIRKAKRALSGMHLDGDDRVASYFEWLPLERSRRLVPNASSNNPLVNALRRLPDDIPPLQRMMYLESKFFLVDHNLNYTDKMSMRHGVEIRVPLIDLHMVRAAARIPLSLKQHGREGKWIFKRVMEKYLPRDVIYRPKTGFGAPVRQWLTGPLQPLVQDMLLAPSAHCRAHINPHEMKKLIAENQTGVTDASYSILAALCFELWLREFLPASASSLH